MPESSARGGAGCGWLADASGGDGVPGDVRVTL